MTPQINFAIASERRADTVRASARTAVQHDRSESARRRLRLPSLRLAPDAAQLECCA